jgi:hypothetical protein
MLMSRSWKSSPARLARLGLAASLLLTPACFDGEGLRGAPCLDDTDCGPKLACLGPQAAAVCGEPSSGTVTGGRWPDSPTVYCSDGEVELSSCPEPGNAGYGQDGNYQIAVPTYELSDGVVHDSVTQLDWESESTYDVYSQSAALLNFGLELPFPDLSSGIHWTSSGGANSDEAWVIDFLSWTAFVYDSSSTASVLCVTGDPLVSSFTTNSDTVRDGLTGLEWQRQQYYEPLPWMEALSHCEGLELAGQTDWRLPSAKELLTLIRDDQQLVAGIDGEGDVFWSSSPSWPPTTGLAVAFPDSTTTSENFEYPNHLRCVRGPGST